MIGTTPKHAPDRAGAGFLEGNTSRSGLWREQAFGDDVPRTRRSALWREHDFDFA